MKTFYKLIEQLFVKQNPSFLETMEQALEKRQAGMKNMHLSKNIVANVIQSKSKQNSKDTKNETCQPVLEFGPTELIEKKNLFCSGFKHLDLSHKFKSPCYDITLNQKRYNFK